MRWWFWWVATTLALEAPSTFDPRVSPHAYGGKKIGVIIVDHGSTRPDANERLEKLCESYSAMRAPPGWAVFPAHMEIARPNIQDAFDACVAAGCEVVVCHPFFLAAGRHAVTDVPALLADANDRHPAVRSFVTPPLGHSPLILDVLHDTILAAVERDQPSSSSSSFEDSFFGAIQAAIAEEDMEREK
ncbi:hypothetical protein CTAYLR_005915 [Chrysophaeum taylorii]|uniref:Sirohydrochlorin cobaltochelatase n=1 Tax=Chrysophaeum taylorii TaxID=2483200 RepID=A0AAD7UAZ2_9STRA|nr:hypothetical protein CTAYLR_005915 [Chrysophaeum taylorii]